MKTSKHPRLRILAAALCAAGAAALALSGCDSAHSKAVDAPAAAGPKILVAPVIERSFTETREYAGRLEAIERVDIRARVAGVITSVNFKPGSLVKKGDVLFVIDPRPFAAEAARTGAAVASSQAKVELARQELARAEKLLAERAIAAREASEKASTLKEYEANLRAALASNDAARLNLAFTEVRAPIDGRVGKAEITVGNLIDPAAVLTSLVSVERIYASFTGDEASYLNISALSSRGGPVKVKIALANETGFPHEGALEFVDNQLNPQNGGVRMRAVFPNRGGTLLPGLFVRVQLDTGSAGKAALLIDERAVGTDQSHKYVIVVGADSKAEFRPVVLGPSAGSMRVVRSGLKAGERVVVSGLQRTQNGAQVAVEEAGGAPAKGRDVVAALAPVERKP